MRKYFGTDGIRGVANVHPMTVEVALNLGRAVAYLFKRGGGLKNRRIVVGKDTRLSCYMFENALASGIASMGAECLLCGPLPTPGVAHVTKSMRADAGLVISASHNPYQDNGIKIFAADGFKLPDETELELERLMQSAELDEDRASSDAVGRVTRVKGVRGRYIEFLKLAFPDDLALDGMKVVVDCANGASYATAPHVFEELGAEVVALSIQPNGRNINEGCGALYPEAVQEAVLREGAQIGIALDGDADRVIVVDEKGQVIDGDAVMAMIATRMLRDNSLKDRTLVATVMSNIGLERYIKGIGGTMLRTQVGDRYVVDEMRRGGYNLGGEQSGHLVFLDFMTTGDGIVGGLQVLAAMLREQKPLSELANLMDRYPQVLLSFKVAQKKPLEALADVQRLIRQAEQQLGAEGRVLVRYSGTEAKARVMIEGVDEGQIRAMAEEMEAALKAACA